jgi:hypothetical protein
VSVPGAEDAAPVGWDVTVVVTSTVAPLAAQAVEATAASAKTTRRRAIRDVIM